MKHILFICVILPMLFITLMSIGNRHNKNLYYELYEYADGSGFEVRPIGGKQVVFMSFFEDGRLKTAAITDKDRFRFAAELEKDRIRSFRAIDEKSQYETTVEFPPDGDVLILKNEGVRNRIFTKEIVYRTGGIKLSSVSFDAATNEWNEINFSSP